MHRIKKLCTAIAVASCIGLVACEGAESRKEKYIGVGVEMLEQGNYEKARISFKNVLKIDPKDIEANFYYAQTLEKLEDWPAAAGQYKHVIDLDPNHTEAAISLGKIMLLAKASDQALEQADAVIKREPKNADAMVLKSGALLMKGNVEEATRLVDNVLSDFPGHADASILRSSVFVEKRDYAAAEKLLKISSDKNPNNVPVLILLSRVYSLQSNAAEAERVLKRIVEVEPRPEHYSKLSEYYFRAERFAESEAVLTEGIKKTPDSEVLKRTLVGVVEKQGDFKRAEDIINTFIKQSDEPEVQSVYLAEKLFQWKRESEAVSLLTEISEQKLSSKASLAALNLLALYKQSKGESEQALVLINKVLEENANDAQALNFRARVSIEKGDYDSAVNDLRAALNQDKRNPQLMKPLVISYLKRGDIDLAVDQVKSLLAIEPMSVDTRALSAQVFEKKKDYAAADEQLQAALKMQPSNVALLQSMVGISIQRKAWESAQYHAERWSKLAPNEAKPYYLQGLAEDAMGNTDKALELHEKALAIAPGTVEPATAIVRMFLIKGQFDDALSWVNRAIEKKANAHLLNLKGEVLLGKRAEKAAIAAFEESIKLQADWWIPYRSIAMIYADNNDLENAEVWFKKGIELAKNSALLRAEFASLLEKQGKFNEATDQYRSIVEATNAVPEAAINNLAMLLVTYEPDQEKIKEALELVKRIEKTENPWYLDTIGWVNLKAGDQEKALQYIKRAADTISDQPVIRYHLGAVYMAQNDRIKAEEELTSSLKSGQKFPGIKDAESLLKKIQSEKQSG